MDLTGRTVLVTGGAGLLARAVGACFTARGATVCAPTRAELDITDAARVRTAVTELRPALIVNAAALTDVDRCQREPDAARAANELGPGHLADAAADVGAELVAVSTDFVFDGERGGYTERDEPSPVQRYGETKLAGERAVRERLEAHYIVRSAWIFGDGGRNFLSGVPGLLAERDELRVVSDQRSSPTYAPDLADALWELAGSGAYGTYHVVNAGSCARDEWVRHVVGVMGRDVRVVPIAWADLGNPVPRPRDSSLVGEAWRAAGFTELRAWADAAAAFVS